MRLLGRSNRPQRTPKAWWRRILEGAPKYGPAVFAQAACFYLVLLLAQVIHDGRTGNAYRLAVGFAIVLVSLGAAEIHFRLYRRVWAVAGLADATALVLAVIEATALVTLADVLIPEEWRPFQRVIPVLAAPIVLSFIAAFRFLPRLRLRRSVGENRLLVVIPDASAYGTLKSLIQSAGALWSVIAVVSATSLEARRTVMGIPVVGDTADLQHWIKVTNADGVAFVHGEVGQPDFQKLVSICLLLEKPIFVIPDPNELFRSPGGSRLRQLSADDLIAHAPNELRLDGAAEVIAGKTVLVTGAAGSVGSELEVLVSITDRDLLLTVFTDERPDIVFHAAAYKHVPMLESHPEQAILVNVTGTKNALWCAEAVSTQDFILISTDKAASTDSVMGCTKRLCELMVLSYRGSMRCRAVRFGNVVGSRGSVIPTFERQIQRGGPVTITHPEMTRYMMTSRQAAALVIATVLLPSPHLYMLDMGDPIRILDMANALIRSRGLRPGKDIEVVFTGVRHGERLSENLFGPEEGWRPTQHPSIRQVLTPMPTTMADLEWTLQHLADLAREQKTTELARALKQAVWTRSTPIVEEPTITNAGSEQSELETTS
jgi:FlaA1/EpsC-like NDP-sugar epimerase